jgi:hypothetical protein
MCHVTRRNRSLLIHKRYPCLQTCDCSRKPAPAVIKYRTDTVNRRDGYEVVVPEAVPAQGTDVALFPKTPKIVENDQTFCTEFQTKQPPN